MSVTLDRDEATLERFSRDMSRYRVRPAAVARPASEDELGELLEVARREGLSITCRGAGSNLSGSAVGPGILAHTVGMDRLLERDPGLVRVQPGIRYEQLNGELSADGRCLRYDVSSGKFSSVGGNVATKAGGLRSVKYGNVDACVRAVRAFTPALGLIDTRERLPAGLEEAILELRDRLQADRESLAFLERRRELKTSSGYNLRALLDHDDPRDVVAHLMVGSVGTLGLLAELELSVTTLPEEKALFVLAFPDMVAAAEAAPRIRELGPSAMEAMDETGITLLAEASSLEFPRGAGAVILVELDEQIAERGGRLRALAGETALAVTAISEDKADAVWNVRWSMLTRIRRDRESSERRYLSFVDDMAVPPPELPGFLSEVIKVFAEESIETVIYGHIGEGNLHMRPLIEREGWRERVHRLAERIFRAALRRGGTLTAEHGSGRNRAPFLGWEWSESLLALQGRVQEIFDPDGLLNPGVVFSEEDFTRRLEF